MQHSLLNTPDTHNGSVGKETLYHLSVDQLLSLLPVDEKDRKYTLSVLTSPPTDVNTVRERQLTLQDLRTGPNLLKKLTDFYLRFAALQHEHEAIRKEGARTKSTGGMGQGAAKNLLQSNALTLKRALLFLRELGDISGGTTLRSAALRTLIERARALAHDPATDELMALCGKFEYTLSGRQDYRLTLNEYGQIECSMLVEQKSAKPAREERKLRLFAKKSDAPAIPCIPLALSGSRLFDTLASEPIASLSGVFDSIVRQIFAEFAAVGKELAFYRVASAYIDMLQASDSPVCYPEVCAEGTMSFRKLYDPLLLALSKKHEAVTPNDLEAPQNGRGIVLFGNNGSGKTVFLRSVGTLQLFAQAGLPVSADGAVVCIKEQLVTHFSQSEKDFKAGNEAGRFEQECSRIADTLNTLKTNSLVLFNEIFQSTAYEEGAKGLTPILRWLSDNGVNWIIVSHIHALRETLSSGDADFFRTASGFVVEKEQE